MVESTKKKAIGIDLGTTYSCVAVYQNNRVEMIPNDQGLSITPSIVSFTEEGAAIGIAAQMQLVKNSQNTIFDAKRLIGKLLSDESVQNDKASLPFELGKDKDDRVTIKVEEKKGQLKSTYYPEQIAAMILKEMKRIAGVYLGYDVKDAVITVPAYFNQKQRTATQDAGKIAGLNVLRIINEPTAASLAFEIAAQSAEDRNILIFDFGGGTFDVSVLSVGDGNNQVLATNGDTHLGGIDIDTKMVEYVVEEFKKTTGVDVSKEQQALNRIRSTCEKVKRILSAETEADIFIPNLSTAKDLDMKLTRAKFEDLVHPILQKLIPPIDAALKDADLTKNEIQEIIMVGGSTKMPKVREMIKAYFGGKVLNHSINPDEAVAAGAAIQAAILNGDQSKQIKDFFLLDVVPLSLGIELSSGAMDTVIKRNTPIPFEAQKVFVTAHDDQTRVHFKVFEGERPMTKDNYLLGDFTINDIEKAPKGEMKFDCKFDIDANGILTVSAYDKKNPDNKDMIVVNTKTLPQKKIDELIKQSQDNKELDAVTKTVLDAIISFEYFCDLLKKKHGDKRLNFTYQERKSMVESYQYGYTMAKNLKDYGKTVKGLQQLTPYMSSYHQKLRELEDVVNPILERVHKAAGLEWRGRKECAGLLEDPKEQELAKTQTCQYFDGDLD